MTWMAPQEFRRRTRSPDRGSPPRPWTRQPPPWWPQGEPWPPVRPPWRWHGGRGRFFWRVGIFIGFFFLLLVGASTLAFWIAAGITGGRPHPFFVFRPLGFMLLLLLLIIFGAGRGVRRVAAPIGDVMDAAERVAGGDYAVRVPERGPPEVLALTRAFNTMVARLQVTDERRRSLLADISHDLRTPLTVIQGNLEGLLEGVYPRDDVHLGPVLEETRLLARLVEDLRTLALVETGALKLEREPVDMGALTADAVASFQGHASEAGVSLKTEIAQNLPTVHVDAFRIREVFENLLANALRYTPRGGEIRVACRLVNGRAGQEIVVSVKDTGPGIAEADLPHVFDRFYKSRDSRGSGLGLTIAKNLVVAHGGEIAAESELGRGTLIRFSLPAA